MQKTLLMELDAVNAALATGNNQGALMLLTNDLLTRTDGCTIGGTPDSNDWIIDCQSQGRIYPLVSKAIQSVQ